jgi:hypothetical protein
MKYVAAVLEVGISHDSGSMTYSFFNMTVLQPSSVNWERLLNKSGKKMTNYWFIKILPEQRDVE